MELLSEVLDTKVTPKEQYWKTIFTGKTLEWGKFCSAGDCSGQSEIWVSSWLQQGSFPLQITHQCVHEVLSVMSPVLFLCYLFLHIGYLSVRCELKKPMRNRNIEFHVENLRISQDSFNSLNTFSGGCKPIRCEVG